MKLMYQYDGDDWVGVICGAAVVTLYGVIQHPGGDNLEQLFTLSGLAIAALKFSGLAIAGGFLGKIGKDAAETMYKVVNRIFSKQKKDSHAKEQKTSDQ